MTKLTQGKLLPLALFLLVTSRSWAVPIGIVDSGTDMKHKDLAGRVWTNPGNLPGDNFKDDVHGWNFAENNNQVIDYSYLGTFSPDTKKFFDVQLKILEGKATPEDKAWLTEKRKDEKFIQELMKFGNFVHGTHVAGIAANSADQAQVMAAKIIPTEVKVPKMHVDDAFQDMLVQGLLSTLVGRQLKMLVGVGEYLAVTKMKVANCSFGTSMVQAKMVAGAVGKMILNRDLTPEETEKYAKHFMNEMVKKGADFTKASPGTLFVMAAGNDGANNDENPVYPASLKEENTITVAATRDYDSLASFSNYGNSVDLAAPGVGIISAIPGDDTMPLSGTSQATPFVTRVLGKMMDANPTLTFAQAKQIIMGTVDKKKFLEGKVKSGGVCNEERALRATELSKSLGVEESIQKALSEVADIQPKMTRRGGENDGYVLPLPPLFTLPQARSAH